ncbi:MAG: hypothetical protein O2899_08270 [Bacteroidetes bacterium]|nr:hypothetical protein [Bacteroidota bacterium]
MSFSIPSMQPSRAVRPACVRWFFAAVLLGLLLAPSVGAQTTGDFRSRASGSWNKSNTWQRFNGSAWVNANSAPDGSGATGQITILSGHTVTGNASDTYDQLVIEAGATLSMTRDISIQKGAGTDLDVYGTLDVGSTITMLGGTTAVFHPGSQTGITNRDALRFVATSQGTFASGALLTSAGTLIP